MVAAEELALRTFLLFLLGDWLDAEGGCESKSKRAEVAASRADREFASLLEASPLALESLGSADVDAAGSLDVEGCREAMNESCTRSYAD